MAWRLVKQPNGLYSRFGEVVNDFTVMNLTREEVIELPSVMIDGVGSIEKKIENAEDAPQRWAEALTVIKRCHGIRRMEERRDEGLRISSRDLDKLGGSR